MAASYDQAVQTLYRGPIESFVAERKRLAGELKASGDKEGAARLMKLARPPISAWAVNQLYWRQREAFERLLATAERLRKGEHDAGTEHQRALTALRGLAATVLESGGHAANESTLRRVALTLSALAATGGFDPDPPGALGADRDPPGFEAFGLTPSIAHEPKQPREKTHAPARRDDEGARHRAQAELERQRAEAEQKRREEEERARKRAERQRITTALVAAQDEAASLQRDVERLRYELGGSEAKLEKARSTVAKLKEALAALD
jgi:hypothetical protein